MKQVPLLEAALGRVGSSNPMLRNFVYALGAQESGFNPNAVGPKTSSGENALGILQVMPKTFLGLQKQFPGLLKDMNSPEDRAVAGVLYAQEALKFAKDDPRIAGAYYYGGPGGAQKAQQGIAVSDPVNKGFPNTLQYGDKIAQRMETMARPVSTQGDRQVAPLVQQAAVAPSNAVTEAIPVAATPVTPEVPLIQQQLAQFPTPTVLGATDPKKVTPNDIDFMSQIFGKSKSVDFSPYMLGMSDKANFGSKTRRS